MTHSSTFKPGKEELKAAPASPNPTLSTKEGLRFCREFRDLFVVRSESTRLQTGDGRKTPPAQNPASPASFTTHSSYDASSLTVENSEQVLYRSDDCTRWTNEKHNLFLNLLEASFVKKMHKSMTLHSQYQEQNMVNRSYSHKLPAKMNRVSKQHPVVQDCHWHNNIERDLADLDTAAISHGSFKDQQICPFSHSEGSDQNFVDEGHKEKTSSKRTNASIREICNHDQIVPSGKFKNPAASSSTLESYDQASHEHLLLENYESFVGPCTNAKYFLNGS